MFSHALGKSNPLSKIADAIRMYFLDHAFVKIGVRGRPAGTSVQDIAEELEVGSYFNNFRKVKLSLDAILIYCKSENVTKSFDITKMPNYSYKKHLSGKLKL